MAAINETFELLPPEAKQEVIDFAEFLAQKYLKKQPGNNHSKEEILNFAGTWKDMNESDFQSLIREIYERRKKSFTKRRKI
ncbi:MAG: DUF2281 domain-containing protein [Candidatus Aminicenantes bacterium]|nr:DUF2281 domain-containing protein [Candidatus Aminicenantes bacterium]NIM79156.1 DUF2281 domain-containing protein [Candidatus Aminicenantes bacterium]NIN18441.1 DUF2281 domain-containing protein [Candidatus Aminicenantes bacterium]NIN42329.1 DUF2281 domain-containing protein [Candidatus Aminicenantes bacterium]NIN85095.1 DUF2281 domain-containing protein [Candidatus Aminicenantes bacterium]